MASARAIQYARTLTPDELRAVHFAVDEEAAAELAEEWARTGLHRVPLEIVDCPDRRLIRARDRVRGPRAVRRGDGGVGAAPRPEVPRDLAPDPARQDRRLPARAAVPVAPCQRHVGARSTSTRGTTSGCRSRPSSPAAAAPPAKAAGSIGPAPQPVSRSRTTCTLVPGCIPIAEATWRERVRVAGRVRSVRVAPQHDAPTVELILVDGTASISVLFLGRRGIAGVRCRHAHDRRGHGRHPSHSARHPQPELPAPRVGAVRAGAARPRSSGARRRRRRARPRARPPRPPASRWCPTWSSRIRASTDATASSPPPGRNTRTARGSIRSTRSVSRSWRPTSAAIASAAGAGTSSVTSASSARAPLTASKNACASLRSGGRRALRYDDGPAAPILLHHLGRPTRRDRAGGAPARGPRGRA